MNINEIDDDLSDLIGGAPRVKPVSPQAAAFVPATERVFTEVCTKCGGSGRFHSWSGRPVGNCFTCKGTGRKTFKTAPEARAKAATSRSVKQATKAAEQAEWRKAHETELNWLAEAGRRQIERQSQPGAKIWQFPIDLCNSFAQYGSLTDGQLAAIRKCMIRDAERQAARQVEKQAIQSAAPAVDVSKIQAAFDRARAKAEENDDNIDWLKVRLGSFTFTDMPAKGQWEACIGVKQGDKFVGRIVAGKFLRKFGCDDAAEAEIIAIAQDPSSAAKAYGLQWKSCACCGRTLTNEESRKLGIGPICAEKFGW